MGIVSKQVLKWYHFSENSHFDIFTSHEDLLDP